MKSKSNYYLRYHRLFETTHIGILILDYKTHLVTDANPFMTKLTNYPLSKFIGKKISEIGLYKKDIEGREIPFSLGKKDEAEYKNIILRNKNGEEKIVDMRIGSVYKEDGRKMIQCTIRDLTEKRKAEQALFESNQRLKALMNALPVGVTFSTDATCKYITGNQVLLKQLEIRHREALSTSTRDKNAIRKRLPYYMNGRLMTDAEMPMQRAIAENREVGPMEIEVRLPSGKRWLMEAIGAPIRDSQGNVIAAVAVNINLTERKRAEEASHLEKLIKEERIKFDFITDVAHELRTPLAIIKGNIGLALRQKQKHTDELKSRFGAIDTEVTQLAHLLSDLTLLTSKESEFRRKIVSHKVRLGKLISRIVKRHVSLAHKKHITLHTERLPDASIIGDERYLERVFSNIISNAISYSKKNGSIRISGSKNASDVCIMIQDNGIGISPKDLPHIFERFYRTDSSRSKDTGGSGLGLAIVKWITEAHGGTVTATSVEGKGSTFSVVFPLDKP